MPSSPEERRRPAQPVHPTPNEASSAADRESHARAIRHWQDQLGGIMNDAQVYRSALEHLGGASTELAAQADRLWPRQSWESSDPPGPPSAHRVDCKVESIAAYAPAGPQVALTIDVTSRGGQADVFVKIPLSAAAPLAAALLEQARFWEEDQHASR